MDKTFLNPFIRFFKRLASIWNAIWAKKRYTFLLLLIIVLCVMVIIIAYPSYYNGVMECASDDILQYYPYVSAFYDKLKSGTMSLYDKNLLIGASWFSGAYYVQIDLFSMFGFLLSYFMSNYLAYSIANYLHIACGALLFYYVLSRHMNNKVSFIGAFILFTCGLTETYYIFPVYLGVNFYAPLAMLLVDLILEKGGKYYLFLPLYVITVVFYDFYVAYMLMAFICFYYVIKSHITNKFSFIHLKNNIFRNGHFWLDFLKFMGMIVIGLMISAAMLMPSAFYILNESNRADATTTESIWYFNSNYQYGGINIEPQRHYFTQLINLFIANEPHRFCLNAAGDYVREHATLYITSGGLIYLIYFFSLKGKMENRYKVWVILFNIMLCIPLFSIILGLNATPYVRWFFIPYMFNLYAACIAMNKFNFGFEERIGKRKEKGFSLSDITNVIFRIIPFLTIVLGVVMVIYVLKSNSVYFIHYDEDDEYYYPLLIGSLIFSGIYLLLLITSAVFAAIRKDKRVIRYSIPVVIFCEAVFAGVIVFSCVTNANSYDYNAQKEMKAQKATLSSLGYDEKDGYRINIYTRYGRETTNVDIGIGNTNFGNYFQSFYNTEINELLYDFYGYTSDVTSWNKTFTYGYNLTSAPIFNTKYVITNESIYAPSKYYNDTIIDNTHYYELKDNNPFIVYDKMYTSLSWGASSSSGAINFDNYYFYRQASLLNYCYIKIMDENEEYTEKKDNEYLTAYQLANKYNVEKVACKDVTNYLESYIGPRLLNGSDKTQNDEYFVYKKDTFNGLKTVLDYDAYNIYPAAFKNRTLADGWMYLVSYQRDSDGNILYDEQGNPLRDFSHQGHFNEIYGDSIETDEYGNKKVDELWVQYDTTTNLNDSIRVCGFRYSLYDNYLTEQAQYGEKTFSLDGDTMHIACTMPDGNKARIIKTAYAYSDDWKIETPGYEKLLVDDSFLGIIVPEGVTDVDITIKYEPKGYKTGLTLAEIGLSIYFMITTTYVIFHNRRENDRFEGGLR